VRLFTWAMQLVIRWMPAAIMRPFIMAFATSNLAPTPRLFKQGAILLNLEGERFTDEAATPWLELPKQSDGLGFIVFDSRIGESLSKWPNYISTAPGVAYAFLDDYRRNRKDIFHTGSTIGELAKKISVPRDALEKTIGALGNDAGSGEWKPPYIALGPLRSWIVLTEGGLAVDTHLRVTGPDGKPIEGLYAAGSNGQGGLLLDGHGNHIGWAVISGRIAARSAAERTRSNSAQRSATDEAPAREENLIRKRM
jgi:succinate dehydrogenase/fumarate reductase flavoprotein subunit